MNKTTAYWTSRFPGELPEPPVVPTALATDEILVDCNRGGSVEDLVHGMLDLHGEHDQPHTLWISARAEVARRT